MVIPVSASELQTRSIATPYVVLTCAVSVIIKSPNSSYDPVIAWLLWIFADDLLGDCPSRNRADNKLRVISPAFLQCPSVKGSVRRSKMLL